ncbi:type I secretion C-terminal target domain-containing protein [Desulfovibrio litoralis]|uniref:Type I secretion C-terminal target domain (VC_A0849 subclass) n=1 Tax=Desulfovibrio litoralis DSM 11393 TaxID=1121455 RepID=A0A1M7SWG0_9BACT|nr:type I secretion C-terminal target domain-containing protein [Desulfovibrio litoralis]SHN62829.1 type I secretion C-terminal target domain (VC_A0849 subclass) [Desulfovibrio litoralis DSM 11393]
MATTQLRNPKGQIVSISVIPNMELAFGFETGTALYSHEDNNLVISFADGGQIILENFYVQPADAMPKFVVEEGTDMPAEQFLAQFNDETLLPAAGPTANAQPATGADGSGLNAYLDNAGNLIDGVDRLNGLGNDQWSRNTEVSESTIANVSYDDSGSEPTGPEQTPYDARAVMYTQDTTTPAGISFFGIKVNSPQDIEWKDPAFKNYFDINIDANGLLTLTLNQAGLDYVAANGTENIYGYITLKNDKGSFNVQVILNQNDDISSKDLNAEDPSKNGGYSLDKGGLKHGEWHQGQEFKNGTLESSDKDDYIRFNNTVSGSTINAGSGKDSVYLGGLDGKNTVIADDGQVTVEKNLTTGTAYAIKTVGEENSVSANKANVDIKAGGDAGYGMYANAGSNTVNTGQGDIALTVSSKDYSVGMEASNGGANTLQANNGNVKIDIDSLNGTGRGINSDTNADSRNTITAKNIDIDVDAEKYAYGVTGQATLKADGDITIDANANQLGAGGVNNTGDSFIDAGGKIVINAKNQDAQTQFMSNNSSTYGVSSVNGTLDIKSGSTIDITASTTGDGSAASGIIQNYGGSTTINAKDDITISATKTSANVNETKAAASGIYTYGNSNKNSISITSETGNITINANDNAKFTTGLGGSGRNSGANGINMVMGNVDVNLNAKETAYINVNQETATPGSYAWGVNNQSIGDFNLNAKQADINIKAELGAKGLFVQKEAATNTVTAETVNMNINVNNGTATAMDSYVSGSSELAGKNIINARKDDGTGKVDIQLNSNNGEVSGMNAARSGQNIIDTDNVILNMTGNTATGLGASGLGASNTIKGNDISINTTGKTGVATGIGASSGGINTITGDTGTTDKLIISTTSGTGGNATGMWASGASTGTNPTASRNTINGIENVTIEASGGKSAYGINATEGGVNEILNANDVKINAKGGTSNAYGVNSTISGQNIIESTGNVDISANHTRTFVNSYGMYAQDADSKNSVNADGNVKINATSTGGNAFGLFSTVGGTNTVTADGNVDIHAKAKETGSGVHVVGKDSKVIIDAGGDVKISGSANSISYARGIAAENKGDISISGKNVTIEATNTGTGYAISVGAIGGTTDINADEKLIINATSTKGTSFGVQAKDSGQNTITATDVEINVKGREESSGLSASYGTNIIDSEKVKINVDQTATGNKVNTSIISGMDISSNYLNPDYKNEIKAKDIEIKVNSHDYNYAAVGMNNTGGKNVITGTGETDKLLLEVTGNSSTGMSPSVGMKASGKAAINTIDGVEDITIDVKDKSKGGAAGLYANTTGTNQILNAEKVNIMVEAQEGHTRGLHSVISGSSNIVAGTDQDTDRLDINVKLQAAGSAYGVEAQGGTNTIRDIETVNIDVERSHTENNFIASGLYAWSKGKNEIINAKNVNIDVDTNGFAYGLYASESDNTISNVENININTTSGKNTATGMHTTAGGKNTITGSAKDTDKIAIITEGNSTGTNVVSGMYATNTGSTLMSSTNTISGIEDVKIKTTNNNTGDTYGIYSSAGGKNTIEDAVLTDVKAYGKGTTRGVHSDNKGKTEIISDNINVLAQNTGAGLAVGVSAKDAQTILTATGGTINVEANANSNANIAYGLATNTDGQNILTAKDVNIDATNTNGGAYGLSGSGTNGINTINATGNVDIDAKGTGVTYGASAYSNGGKNVITADSVNISAESSSNNAYGLHAVYGTNTIQAHENATTGIEVRITVTAGAGKEALAMYAGGTAAINKITGTEHSDYVNIKGNIYAENGGKNIISTGAGDDTVVLDGKVYSSGTGSPTGLTLEMGDGYDILTLKATSFNDFETKFSAWLLQMAANPKFGVESIEVTNWSNWSQADQASLLDFFSSNSQFAGIDVPKTVTDDFVAGTVDHTNPTFIDRQSSFDGIKDGADSVHNFNSDKNDTIRVDGDVSHTDLTFADAGHDSLNISGALHDSSVNTDVSYNGTLNLEAGSLDNSNLDLLGGINNINIHGEIDNFSSVTLGSGNDTLNVQGDFTGTINMGAGDDTVMLHGNADGGTVHGGDGNDTIIGDAGNNTLYGDAGNDILNGGDGNDVLYGGFGADTFVWEGPHLGGTDTIMDFNIAGGDKIELEHLFSDTSDLSQLLHDHRLDLKVNQGNNSALELTIKSSGGETEQTIIIHGSTQDGSSLGVAYADIGSDQTEQLALLQQIIILQNQ